MDKKATAVAKSIGQFAKTLEKSGIKNANKIVDDAMFAKNGTGSMILDFLTRKQVGKNTGYKNMQRKLADIDMKAGGKVYDFLDNRKSGIANSLKKSLVQEHDILHSVGTKGMPDKYIRVKSTGLLNPVAKTKDTVFPIVGSMATANFLLNKQKDGEKNVQERINR